jgi:hypothetical protein
VHVVHGVDEAAAEQPPPGTVRHRPGEIGVLRRRQPRRQRGAVGRLPVSRRRIAAEERRRAGQEAVGGAVLQRVQGELGGVLDADLVDPFRLAWGLDLGEERRTPRK